MTEFNFDMNQKGTSKVLIKFAEELKKISDMIGFKVSSRGWCYQIEDTGAIDKSEFDKVQNWINSCRRKGILPIDFTAEEEGRKFSGVETPDTNTPIQDIKTWIAGAMNSEEYYTPDWWAGEKYYIQMLVEKIDLKTLFTPVCKKYHIPIATSRGWSSILQRGIYARRFLRAEQKDLKCVLLYCGDHDPDGLQISKFLRKNLDDLKNITWTNGMRGYDPKNLNILRFGLNYDFIEKHKLSWTNNLITGTKDKKLKGIGLDNPRHPNHKKAYVQEYLKKFGARKVEANAIVPKPLIAGKLVKRAIINYVGNGALRRFESKMDEVKAVLRDFKERTGLQDALQKALDLINEEDE